MKKLDSSLRCEPQTFIDPTERMGLQWAQRLRETGRHEEATNSYEQVTRMFPGSVLALHELGASYYDTGQDQKAIETFQRALVVKPDDAHAGYAEAYTLMSIGKLGEGFAKYVARYRRFGTPKTMHNHWPTIPWWDEEDLNGKTLLIWTEQGVGDELLLSSMLPDVISRGAHVILVCTARVSDLLKLTFPDITYVLRADSAAALVDPSTIITADYQAGLSELGVMLRDDFSVFPDRPKGWLKYDEEKSAELRTKYLNGETEPLIGISWESNNPFTGGDKSTSLMMWKKIFDIPGLKFVNLQYDYNRNIVEAVNSLISSPIISDDSIDPKKSLVDFANQVAAMDLVISVSNTTVHVAGALGVPVWNIVPNNKGRIWYWFKDRTDSPWYKTMRILRNIAGIWDVLGNIEGTLKEQMKHVE